MSMRKFFKKLNKEMIKAIKNKKMDCKDIKKIEIVFKRNKIEVFIKRKSLNSTTTKQ